ncbi:hypothetical protein SERLADRAFT_432140 [Serpula lacrymans var. lacrymans S7.9]|uniref:Uncharacterized protein n=1 Tax=Serpula lacrymans var. lacrymans (strain S7.9) TaxID=578457 RepID=F8NED5_SERL9|nr:uncharacterized protein SERLADRAFT_432140 [Serpula lacrymans var. lacrymans S7.9]EGO30569.1 hypothetical protein SERLADRAFT_432140 [Serpula lacrymans var. lacrymans S7.9]
MVAAHVSGHKKTQLHKRHASYLLEGHIPSSLLTSASVSTLCKSAHPLELRQQSSPENQPFEDYGMLDEDSAEVPLLQLWDDTLSERTAPLDDELAIEDDLIDMVLPESFSIEVREQTGSIPSSNHSSKVPKNSPYYPWPSLAICSIFSPLFDFISLFYAQKSTILDWARELNTLDVPSLNALQNTQKNIKELVGNPTSKITSKSGNIFYLNDVAKAIAKDYANPVTRFSMQDYPEDPGKGMAEVFHGEKMLLELPSEITPPAYFIPQHFFTDMPPSGPQSAKSKSIFSLGNCVERTEIGFVVDDEQVIIAMTSFARAFDSIALNGNEFACGFTGKFKDFLVACSPICFILADSSAKYSQLMPNPWCAKSGGHMVYSVPLIIFMDDVSGNISKQWNKHHAIYMLCANMPREMIEKEFYLCFVTSSLHATPMEMIHAMKESIL